MKFDPSWDMCGLSVPQWVDLTMRLKAGLARRIVRQRTDSLGLLDWSRCYLPQHFRRPPSAMHLWLGEQLDAMVSGRGQRLNVVGPRGGAKSTVATLAYVLRAVVEGWEPYVWIVSDTKHQARAHLENLKAELVENAQLRSDYPQAVGRGHLWRGNMIQLANGVTVEAYGTGQRVRGKRQRANRPTLIVCDDLQNDGHMRSPELREQSRRWFTGTLLNAGTKHTNIVHLATALHREALALVLERTPGWTSRVFAAIERWPDNMSLWHEWEAIYTDVATPTSAAAAREFFERNREAMQAGAKLLWPEEEDLYTLMRLRVEGGRAAFDREKQGVPINPEQCEWPEAYFDESIWFEDWPRNLQLKVVTLDPSKGRDARRSELSALVMLGVDYQGVLHVEADLARRATPEMVAAGVEICRTFRPDAFGVETNQYQELLAAEFEAEFARQSIVGIQPWSIDNRVNKQVRIRRLGPYMSARRLRFRDTPGTRLLVEQLREFPVGDHDDGPDALEMAIRLAGDLVSGAAAGDGLGGRLPVGVL